MIVSALVALTAGCALPGSRWQPLLTVNTYPQGAVVSDGGAPPRLAPFVLSYKRSRGTDCVRTAEFSVVWQSGTKTVTSTQLCGGDGTYQITIRRPADAPGLDYDLRVAAGQQQRTQGDQTAAQNANSQAIYTLGRLLGRSLAH